jgi:uncharacterized protein YecE (DUF72 family)
MIWIGCSGWFYQHWIGKFYPSSLEKKEWLSFYAKSFNTAEVNMTFYRFPFSAVLKSWYNKTPANFKFTFKANRLITHVKRFEETQELVKKFLDLLNLVKEKLACVLWQLPPGMHFSDRNLKLLDSFLSSLSQRDNVVEFRHKSWWRKETYELLKGHGAAFCMVSCPQLPDSFVVTSDIAYVRFHGSTAWYRHDYQQKELEEWGAKIKRTKGKEVYCYFNNDYEAYAPKNATQLKGILGK